VNQSLWLTLKKRMSCLRLRSATQEMERNRVITDIHRNGRTGDSFTSTSKHARLYTLLHTYSMLAHILWQLTWYIFIHYIYMSFLFLLII